MFEAELLDAAVASASSRKCCHNLINSSSTHKQIIACI
jgi:hypothetical protein